MTYERLNSSFGLILGGLQPISSEITNFRGCMMLSITAGHTIIYFSPLQTFGFFFTPLVLPITQLHTSSFFHTLVTSCKNAIRLSTHIILAKWFSVTDMLDSMGGVLEHRVLSPRCTSQSRSTIAGTFPLLFYVGFKWSSDFPSWKQASRNGLNKQM